MSWQRILEIARRKRMPMIVTDVAGREPMVVLPFDEYEALVDSGLDGQAVLSREQIRLEPTMSPEPSQAPQPAERPAPRVVGPTTPYNEALDSAKISQEFSEGGGISLEESFVFEPVP